MWEYKQPGFALRLLCELQKQQQHSLHCDILLQTQGVSIPAHSCVLSALSPVFCSAFANVPSLPIGQHRLVQLEAVGAHALMKLVGFMYSGEMEGESLDEQQEVIDTAYRLGFSNFVDWKKMYVNRHQDTTASCKEIGLQTEETGGRKNGANTHILSEKRIFSHSGTQTDIPEAHVAEICVASEPKPPVRLTGELTEASLEFNGISPGAGLAWIDDFAAHSPLSSAGATVRGQTKSQHNQKAKKRPKSFKKVDTQISLKIKLKRQRSGELWEVVSVQEESTAEGSKTCRSSDDPLMTHGLAETHMRVQPSLSPSLTCQNLATVTLTPPLEATTSLPATPTRPPSEHHCHNGPVPLSSTSSPLQMLPLSPVLSQHEESDEHAAMLLEMVAVDINILPSVTVEGHGGTLGHVDPNMEKCAALSNSSPSCFCLFDHDLGTVEFGTPCTSKQTEAGSEDQSNRSKWNLKNMSSVASDLTSLSWPSPCHTQKKNIDSSFTPPCPMTDIVPSKFTFAPEGLQPQDIVELKNVLDTSFWGAYTYSQHFASVTNEDANTTAALDEPTSSPEALHVTDQVSVWQSSVVTKADTWEDFSEMRLPRCLSPLAPEAIFTQDPFPPLEFSPCLSTSRANRQPAIRCTSSPVQPQAFPGKSNPHYPSFTSPRLDELKCSGAGKNSCPLKSNRGYNGEVTHTASEEKRTKMTGFEMNPKHVVETVNEPFSKKAKTDGFDAQTSTVVRPCSVKVKNLRHIPNIPDISNPVTPDIMGCPRATITTNTVSKDLESQKLPPQCKKSQPIKSKAREACGKKVQDLTQLALMAAKCRPHRKRKCTTDRMKDSCTKSKKNSSSPVPSSTSCHEDLQVTYLNMECPPSRGSGKAPKAHRPSLGRAPTINDLISECEQNKVAEPQMENPFVEPENVIPAVNLNREDEKQPKMDSFCDKIFHQTNFSVDLAVADHFLPVNHQPISILQTSSDKKRTSLPPSLTSKKLRESPGPVLMSPKLTDNFRQEKNDKTEELVMEKDVPGPDKPGAALDTDANVRLTNEVESEHVDDSSIDVDKCLVNGNIVSATMISANAGLSVVDLNADFHFCTVPSARDGNDRFQLENNSQQSTTRLFHPFNSENVMEKPKTDERMTESNDPQEESVFSIRTSGVNVIQTKELHLEESRSMQIGKDLDKENTVQVDISGMNEKGAEMRDIEMLEKNGQSAAGHGDEVVANGGNTAYVEQSENSVDVNNDGETVAHEEEFNGQHKATYEVTLEVIDTNAPSNQHGESSDLSSSSVYTVGSTDVILLDVNAESAKDCSNDEEELVVDDVTDSPVQFSPVVVTWCNTILEEEDVLKEQVVVKMKDDEEEEDVDVTGEESN